MHVTVYRRNRAAEKKAEIEAEITAKAEQTKKRGRPRKAKKVKA